MSDAMSDTKALNETPPPMQIVWKNVVVFTALHALGIYGLFQLPSTSWKTLLYLEVLIYLSSLGGTAAVHRYWSHKAFKAREPLRIFLAFCNTIILQNSILVWARDHRVHHKFSETNADPYNAKRGFFFSHMGWFMVRKHPLVIEKGNKLDVSDLKADPLVMFQYKYYVPLIVVFGIILPSVLPTFLWGETMLNGFLVGFVLRYLIVLHFTWLVNSAGHMWGLKPYDRNIGPTDSWWVALVSTGEGYHNFHHTFPTDYSNSEWGFKINLTTYFIDAMAYIGQAYDLKVANPELVKKRALRTGDRSLYSHQDCHGNVS